MAWSSRSTPKSSNHPSSRKTRRYLCHLQLLWVFALRFTLQRSSLPRTIPSTVRHLVHKRHQSHFNPSYHHTCCRYHQNHTSWLDKWGGVVITVPIFYGEAIPIYIGCRFCICCLSVRINREVSVILPVSLSIWIERSMTLSVFIGP